MAKTRQSISTRWFVNSLGVVVVLIVIFITTMSFSVQSYVYNGIQQILISRSDELLNVFASSGTSSFTTVSRAYIENFPDKNDMEIMLISKTGNVSVTSTGFQPDQTQIMPDYVSALSSDVNFGYWIGELDTGEKVMAITRVVRNEYNSVEGSLRYVVSITEADEQIFMFILLLITVGLGITLAITFSGIYFVRSILTPVRQISVTAQKISDGNFDVRIEKFKDDEIGQLIDTINIMAEELGNSERMKNDFISSVSHELRTPLTAIKGWAETLEVTEQDEKTRKQGMNIIIKESQRLTGIVEELLDFSRIQNGRMNLNLVKTDVLAELDEVVFLFTERAKSEDKKMIYDDVAILSPIMADMNRLKQVFVNIIDNAIKYTEAGGQIKIVSYEEKEQIFIVVEDTGCGIASEHIPHIKKKFYKANQVVRGSGIGLAVADEIVALHGGELEVQSTLGKGTKVTISLPIIEK